MIEFYLIPGTPRVVLDNYNELFNCGLEGRDLKSPIEPGNANWSFTVHSPDRVAALYHNARKGSFAPAIDPDLQEAYDEQLSLLELCTGDYNSPQYIAVTANIDMDALKKKWCQDYCAFNKIDIRETVEEETDAFGISEESVAEMGVLPC